MIRPIMDAGQVLRGGGQNICTYQANLKLSNFWRGIYMFPTISDTQSTTKMAADLLNFH